MVLVIIVPTNIEEDALEFVYSAKLCGTLSWLSKFIVTLAPAGTVIVLLLKAMLSAIRSIMTLVVVGVGVGDVVGVTVGVGDIVTVGVGDVVGVDVAVAVAV